MLKREIVKFFGSGAKLAAVLGISRKAVIKWESEIPNLRKPQIREAIFDKIERDKLFYEQLCKNK